MNIIEVVVLALVGYALWRFVIRGKAVARVGLESGKSVSATVARVVPGKAIVLEVNNPAKAQRITSITLSRSVADQLGLGPPPGFAEEPLALREVDEGETEAARLAQQFDAENVRWVGSHPLKTKAISELVIPAKKTAPLSGLLRLQYERAAVLGGSMSFLRVDLGRQG